MSLLPEFLLVTNEIGRKLYSPAGERLAYELLRLERKRFIPTRALRLREHVSSKSNEWHDEERTQTSHVRNLSS